MIDKLDLRIHRDCTFQHAVRDYTRGLPYETYTARVRPAVHYIGKADLRHIGIDAILHVQCKHGEKHHKLEILDVGKKPHSEIVRLIESVTDANPAQMGIMRIDLTADVKDITVPWCKPRVRFKYKRIQKEYGELKYGTIGRGEVETIWAGCRPNVFRIYNKIAESMVQFRRMQLRAGKNAEPPDFEKEFGFKKTDILTRVERQCGGNRIPLQLQTFGDLHNAPDFNPFDALEIVSSGHPNLPTPGECEGLEYYTGIGMHFEAQRLGMQQFRKSLNQQSKGNAARTIERYRRFFAADSENAITAEQIYGIYRDSVQKQLAT